MKTTISAGLVYNIPRFPLRPDVSISNLHALRTLSFALYTRFSITIRFSSAGFLSLYLYTRSPCVLIDAGDKRHKISDRLMVSFHITTPSWVRRYQAISSRLHERGALRVHRHLQMVRIECVAVLSRSWSLGQLMLL